MKHLLIAVGLLGLALTTPTIAGQAEYDDCILEYLKNAKLDLATHLIKQACEENYKKSSFTSGNKRAYNNCLLEHLVGVESIQAVMAIKSACGKKFN